MDLEVTIKHYGVVLNENDNNIYYYEREAYSVKENKVKVYIKEKGWIDKDDFKLLPDYNAN